jgi:hypothetical protein
MLPVFAIDGARLIPERSAMVAAIISDLLAQADADLGFLYEAKLDANLVAKDLLSRVDLSTYALADAELRFLEVCVQELASRLIAIADRLPMATASFRKKMLNDVAALHVLGSEILTELVRFTDRNRRQDTLLVDNFDLRYRSSIRQFFGQIELFGLDIDGWAVRHDIDVSYVSLRVEWSAGSLRRDTSSSPLEIRADDVLKYSSRVIIRGQAGSGKTTLMQWLAVQVADRQLPAHLSHLESLVPILIRLRDYAGMRLPVGPDLLACASPTAAANAPAGWLDDLMRRDRLLLLIDGADEVSLQFIWDVRRWIIDFITHSPGSKVILTTRPSALPTDFLSDFTFESYFLAPMSAPEIDSFVTYWHEGLEKAAAERGADIAAERKRSELIDTLRAQPILRRMATSPLVCAILCTLNLRNRLAAITDRIDLYTVAFRLIAHERESFKKIVDSAYMKLSFPLKERLLGEIAYWIVRTERTHCSQDDVIRITGQCLGDEILSELEVSKEELGRDVILRSGVLKDVSLDAIEFLHKTCQEFLAAEAIGRAPDENLAASKFSLREWSELILMVASLTSERNAVELIRKLLERQDGAGDPFYCLLAASCLSAVSDASDLKEAVTERLAGVIPPRDHGSAKLLADAGELVVPLLRYSDSYGSFQNTLIVETLSQVRTPQSRRTMLDYVRNAELEYGLLKAVVRAIDEDDDAEFEGEACRSLINRCDPRVCWHARHGTVRVLFREMELLEPYLKGVKAIVFDGSGGMDLHGILHDGFLSYRRICDIWICNFDRVWTLSQLEKYTPLKTLYFINIDRLDSTSYP